MKYKCMTNECRQRELYNRNNFFEYKTESQHLGPGQDGYTFLCDCHFLVAGCVVWFVERISFSFVVRFPEDYNAARSVVVSLICL